MILVGQKAELAAYATTEVRRVKEIISYSKANQFSQNETGRAHIAFKEAKGLFFKRGFISKIQAQYHLQYHVHFYSSLVMVLQSFKFLDTRMMDKTRVWGQRPCSI